VSAPVSASVPASVPVSASASSPPPISIPPSGSIESNLGSPCAPPPRLVICPSPHATARLIKVSKPILRKKFLSITIRSPVTAFSSEPTRRRLPRRCR
jgi:hypothetical protein